MTELSKNEAREHARRIIENAKEDSTLAIADKAIIAEGLFPEDLSEVLAQMRTAHVLVTWDDEVVAEPAKDKDEKSKNQTSASPKG
jgi:hypothetical protein